MRCLDQRIEWAVGEQIAGKDRASAPEACVVIDGTFVELEGRLLPFVGKFFGPEPEERSTRGYLHFELPIMASQVLKSCTGAS